MKNATYFLIGTIVLAFCNPIWAQDESKVDDYEQLKAAVTSGSILIALTQANTQRGSTIFFEESVTAFEFSSQRSIANMPFYGNTRVLTSDFGASNIEFDGEVERLRVKENDKKERIQISYSISGGTDRYSISLTLSAGGMASIGVSSVNRDRITYKGNYQIE